MKINHLRPILIGMGWLLLLGCQSLSEAPTAFMQIEPVDMRLSEPPRDITYEQSKWDDADWPQPRFRSVYIVLSQSGEEKARELAYHAWDVNHDGETDMLEAIDSKGQIFMRLYDFDFDGQIDTSEKLFETDGRKFSHLIK